MDANRTPLLDPQQANEARLRGSLERLDRLLRDSSAWFRTSRPAVSMISLPNSPLLSPLSPRNIPEPAFLSSESLMPESWMNFGNLIRGESSRVPAGQDRDRYLTYIRFDHPLYLPLSYVLFYGKVVEVTARACSYNHSGGVDWGWYSREGKMLLRFATAAVLSPGSEVTCGASVSATPTAPTAPPSRKRRYETVSLYSPTDPSSSTVRTSDSSPDEPFSSSVPAIGKVLHLYPIIPSLISFLLRVFGTDPNVSPIPPLDVDDSPPKKKSRRKLLQTPLRPAPSSRYVLPVEPPPASPRRKRQKTRADPTPHVTQQALFQAMKFIQISK
ncbi:hypothetical protein V8E54_001054 [Elaphomyces granulatus]